MILYLTMITIGITGTIASGKGAVVEILKEKGFLHYSARTFILEEVKKRGLDPVRSNTFQVANDLRRLHHPGYIIEQLFAKAKASGNNSVIESIRATGELDFLKKQDNFYLIAVDADPTVRYARAVGRNSSLDKVSFEKFIEDEKNEMKSVNPNELNINTCMERADFKIMNNGSKEDLRLEVEGILKKIMPK